MPAQDWISECQLAIAHGYNSFKTKGRPWFDVIENTRLLCDAVPPHFEIDIDFNGFGVDTAHCTRLLKELEQFPQVVMYESPIPHADVAVSIGVSPKWVAVCIEIGTWVCCRKNL